ncbi:hypothetical protein ACVIIW_002348 [Bradyrhizobium sp. USDA 4449]
MRVLALLAGLSISATSAFAAEEPSGCDKFKWPIERDRAALTAPDRAKLASGAEQAALPSSAITLDLVSGATDCDGIRKTMKYQLSDKPFVLQVSGAKDSSMSISIVPAQ